MHSNLASGLTITLLALALVLGGFGAGTALSGQQAVTSSTTGQSSNNSSEPFVVTLVVATESIFNASVGDQPAFFVLGPHGLESTVRLALPVNRTIELVIVNYDDGQAEAAQPSLQEVKGTEGGVVLVASNENVNSTQGTSGIVIRGGENASSIAAGELSHTFTIPSLNLNIPIPVSSTVVALFTITRSGTYLWFCLTACGDAAMAQPGWMTGSVVAS